LESGVILMFHEDSSFWGFFFAISGVTVTSRIRALLRA